MGWEIGFHTNTHSDLRKLNNKELFSEIVGGKNTFEKRIGFKIKYFAYPRGIYSTKIIESVDQAGFQAAFTVDGCKYIRKSDKLNMGRISIEGSLSLHQFQGLISPFGIVFSYYFMRLLIYKEKLQFTFKS